MFKKIKNKKQKIKNYKNYVDYVDNSAIARIENQALTSQMFYLS